MRHTTSDALPAVTLLFLTAHAATIALAQGQSTSASFAWLIAAPVLAGSACVYRGWKQGLEGWLPLGVAIFCWAGGMMASMVGTLFLSIQTEQPLSMLLYLLYGVPLIFALASPETERWQVRLVDALLAGALGYLFYAYVDHLITGSQARPGDVNALKVMFDIENGYIALFALLRLAAAPVQRQPFFRIVAGYAIAYMLCAGYNNHYQGTTPFGRWPDLVIDAPFLLLAWLALSGMMRAAKQPGEQAGTDARRASAAFEPLSRWTPNPAFVRVIRAGSPLAIPVTLLTISVLLVPLDVRMAVAGCVAASLGYGLRTVMVQLRTFEEHDRLTRLSHVDALTGIANRRLFDQVLAREWARRAQGQGRLALLMIDIDHFKQLNDRYGHSVGDDWLRRVAAVLSQAAGAETDLVARHGGEEFAAILTQTSPADAGARAERMRESVASLRLPAGRGSGGVTVSIGMVCAQPHDTDLATFVAHADAALYDAKRRGRNQVVHHALRPLSAGGAVATDVLTPSGCADEERPAPGKQALTRGPSSWH